MSRPPRMSRSRLFSNRSRSNVPVGLWMCCAHLHTFGPRTLRVLVCWCARCCARGRRRRRGERAASTAEMQPLSRRRSDTLAGIRAAGKSRALRCARNAYHGVHAGAAHCRCACVNTGAALRVAWSDGDPQYCLVHDGYDLTQFVLALLFGVWTGACAMLAPTLKVVSVNAAGNCMYCFAALARQAGAALRRVRVVASAATFAVLSVGSVGCTFRSQRATAFLKLRSRFQYIPIRVSRMLGPLSAIFAVRLPESTDSSSTMTVRVFTFYSTCSHFHRSPVILARAFALLSILSPPSGAAGRRRSPPRSAVLARVDAARLAPACRARLQPAR